MDDFKYSPKGELMCEGLKVSDIAEKLGTPLYLYSSNTLKVHYRKLKEAFAEIDPLICFSMKTNNNIYLLRELISEGSGIDTVSGGEIYVALKAGVAPEKIVYAGIGKTDEEISFALDSNIGIFNIESEQEFENISRMAGEKGKKVKAALRVTPDVVDAKTHDKTKTGYRGSKFGVDIERAKAFFLKYKNNSNVNLCGIHIHIGSPIYSPDPYLIALKKIGELIGYLKTEGIKISILDIGGGFAADYSSNKSPKYNEFASALVPVLKPYYLDGTQIIMEPGRTISANSGILVTRVTYLKQGGDKQFVVVDTGMHHLIRPALYDAEHFIWPVSVSGENILEEREINKENDNLKKYDIVGPICESSDYLAKNRLMPEVKRGDLISVFTAGAYGIVMSSQYNAMPRPAEAMVDGNKLFIIREREVYEDLLVKINKSEVKL
jgi:diaminopimelate decarboxylase